MKASLEVLMDGLIDYAGLFPPASLDMQSAVEQYAFGRTCERARWLGRFVVPASRLGEFADAQQDCLARMTSRDLPWRLAALGEQDRAAALPTVVDFNPMDTDTHKTAVVDTLETKVDSAAAIPPAIKNTPAGITHYFEIPIQEDPSPFLVAIAQAHARAKVRTGGVRPALFPPAQNLARFLVACHRMRVGFKATAGLHHPVRGTHRLTYARDSAETVMHGFLNVFLAAGFAANGMDVDMLTSLLEDEASEVFSFRDDAAIWRGHRLAIERIHEVRENFAISFGSCSLDEPRQGLREMGLI